MAGPERSLVGAVESFRAKEHEHIPFEEIREKDNVLRMQVQNLVRNHIEPPYILEIYSGVSTLAEYEPAVTLEAKIPSASGDVEVTITADSYPLLLTEDEQKIADESGRAREINRRLNGIKYGINIDSMDHRVVIDGGTKVISKLPEYGSWETRHYPRALASVDDGFTAGIRSFTREDYRLYGELLDLLSTDPSISFDGHAKDIYRHVYGEQKGHFVRRPAEMSTSQTPI